MSPPPSIDLPCMPADRPVRERLDEPLGEEGEFRVVDGRPCMLFASWDYAEDWSGEFVRTTDPLVVGGGLRLSRSEFWALVRTVHGIVGR